MNTNLEIIKIIFTLDTGYMAKVWKKYGKGGWSRKGGQLKDKDEDEKDVAKKWRVI